MMAPRESSDGEVFVAVSVNLPAYLERIGFAGSIAPTLDTLTAICRLHPTAIPFENLNALLGVPVRLDQPSLERKLLLERRGGYCFEHNLLLLHVLLDLGFVARGLLGRAITTRPEEANLPLDHMLVAVDLGSATYLADVGFGNATPTSPLKLKPDLEQDTPHERYRLLGNGPYRLEIERGGSWLPLYAFDLTAREDADYEAPNLWTSTNPEAHFRSRLVAARAGKDRRHALHDTVYSIYPTGGEPERRTLTSVAELREVLSGQFGINLPPAELLDPALASLLPPADA